MVTRLGAPKGLLGRNIDGALITLIIVTGLSGASPHQVFEDDDDDDSAALAIGYSRSALS